VDFLRNSGNSEKNSKKKKIQKKIPAIFIELCRKQFWSRLFHFRPIFEVKIGVASWPLLTQLATPILTSKIGLGDESGPDIR
jgi:hypothetical protein